VESLAAIRVAGVQFALCLLLIDSCARAQALNDYQTPYYVIHTDLGPDDVRETQIRMTRMFETYRARTQGFSGDIQTRFQFYLYMNKEDYLQAGGPTGSAGVFSGSVLMATANGAVSPKTWTVIQHEGFHQFAKMVIRGDLPTWLNEGMAEYFGESLFTGDSFHIGLIPPNRLSRLQDSIKNKRMKSFGELMTLTHDQWNRKLVQENYDQAWSIVYYLVHAEDGKHQTAFVNYITAIGKGSQPTKAWRQANLPDPKTLEKQWMSWWLNQPPDPTADQYTEAYAQTFASYLARAAVQHQGFNSFDQFAKAARSAKVRTATVRNGIPADSWLPPRLLIDDFEAAAKSNVRWTLLNAPNGGRGVSADCPDGAKVTATCVYRMGEPAQMSGKLTPADASKRRGK
jgi:uncharacterized protein DUF1570